MNGTNEIKLNIFIEFSINLSFLFYKFDFKKYMGFRNKKFLDYFLIKQIQKVS